MNISWQSLILFHALFSALQALQFRAIARTKTARYAGLAINAVAFSTVFVCCLLVLPVVGSEVDSDSFRNNILLFVSASALVVVALSFMYKAMAHLESAIVSVLGTSSAMFTVIFAMFFFDERLSSVQLIGVGLLVLCIWYVLLLARKGRSLVDFNDQSWIKGLFFVLLSSFCLSFGHILEKEILYTSTPATYMAYGGALQAVLAWTLYFIFGRRHKKVFRVNRLMKGSIQLGVLRTGAMLFFVLALVKSDSVSLVAVVANFRIILVAVLAGWLLKERQYYYKKLAAAAVSVLALSIVFWN